MKRTMYNSIKLFLLQALILFLLTSCSKEDNPLAPYEGPAGMSNILVEKASFTPQITWVGGYASVLGINKGSVAALDTSLIWLVKTDGNNLHYPVKFGSVPGNAADITAQFGGTSVNTLSEDENYTFWVMKQEAWDQISSTQGARIFVDTTLSDGAVNTVGDSVTVSRTAFTNFSQNLDVYINIEGISVFGKLGAINIESSESNSPRISWEITQTGIDDPDISVIGICEGQQYNSATTVWEVYSETTVNGEIVYGASNVISSPVFVGDSLSQTRPFVELETEGLERNKTYYLWIANNTWDGESRLRFADGYAYATFNTR